ncbi:MAG: DNA recombination protein RmuC [Bacteroidales bacterium]|nr:DNA recombination protein RmuC [Bacteroidales bacterium]MBR1894000.1 DNA recombination protein RmuC [Bacteroidales bacterium]
MSDNLILLLFCITLLLLVIAVVFLVLQERRHAAEKAALVQDYEARRDVLQEEVSSLKSEKSALESRLEVQRQAQEAMLQAEKEHAAKSLEEMRSAFKALSAENSEHFRKTSAESVGELLKPIQERFKEFSEHVKSSDEKNAERSGSMEKMIRILSEQSRSIGDQARALADAITGQSKTQGDFGEMLLVDLLRESGLQEGVNFDVQNVLRDELGHEIKSDDGRVMIPDVIVHYPDGGEVIVDSKVSLKAFVEWNQATLPEDRKKWAREHIRSIRSHVDELRGKDYASYIPEGRRKIDYNLMFVPIENAFRLMQEEEPLLWQQAKNQGVLIVSQMSLAIVLNMILVAWRQFDQQRNIQEVFKTASELMSALENWMGEYVKVGERLEALNKSYGESSRLLSGSSQSVVKKVAKLEKLGATRKRSSAALKTGGRMIGGRESVIPGALAGSLEEENQ